MKNIKKTIGNYIYGIIVGIIIIFILVVLILLGPQLSGKVTVQELNRDYNKYLGWTMKIKGKVEEVRPYPFSIGEDVDNYVLKLEDKGASVDIIYDNNKLDFELKPGDSVVVKCSFIDYNDNYMLHAIRIKPENK